MIKIFLFILAFLNIGLPKGYDLSPTNKTEHEDEDNLDQLLGDEQCLNSTELREMMSNILDEITDMKECFLRREGINTESACMAGVEESVQRVLEWVKTATGMEEQPGFSGPGESHL